MFTRFLEFLLILICLFVVYFTYFEGLLYNKRNSDRGFHKYKDIDVILLPTFQKHKNKSLDLIRNGIFWSSYAESLVPKGMIISSWVFFVVF